MSLVICILLLNYHGAVEECIPNERKSLEIALTL